MPDQPDLPGGSNDPTRAHDPIDPTRAHDPVEPTRVQPGVDPTRAQDATWARPAATRAGAPVVDEPLRRVPDDDDRDRAGAWWLWALLAAVLIAIVLFALLTQGDDDDGAVGTADQAQTGDTTATTAPQDTAPEDTTADAAPEDTATDDTAATDETTTTAAPAAGGDATDPGAGDAGTVTAASDGTDLFTLVQGDAGDAERLAPYADQDVTGAGVHVLDVVDGEGFWIGVDESRRIFAHAPDDVAVEVGERIDFDGFLKPNPAEDSAEVHDIPEDQGAELHRQQGHHIELRSLTPA